MADALQWSEAIGSEVPRRNVERACREHWGEPFDLWLLDQQVAEAAADAPLPKKYETAVAALAAVLSRPTRDSAELQQLIRRATEAALVSLDDARLEEDLVSRLLTVYRCLLQRRPAVPPRVAYTIENELLQLAVRERMKSDRHWSLWAEATRELGPDRVSKRFQRYLKAMADRKDLPAAQRRAIERPRPLLARVSHTRSRLDGMGRGLTAARSGPHH